MTLLKYKTGDIVYIRQDINPSMLKTYSSKKSPGWCSQLGRAQLERTPIEIQEVDIGWDYSCALFGTRVYMLEEWLVSTQEPNKYLRIF